MLGEPDNSLSPELAKAQLKLQNDRYFEEHCHEIMEDFRLRKQRREDERLSQMQGFSL